tara:strand:+ start:7397 stop:7882 length:486 start_codon:yes stop_codon:yes gene_type:complete
MGIESIFEELGADVRLLSRPDKWDRNRDRFLAGTVEDVRVAKFGDDPDAKVTITVKNHEGRSLIVYHTAAIAYALCDEAGVRWQDIKDSETSDALDCLLGRFVCFYYRGQDANRKDMHLFDIWCSADPVHANREFVRQVWQRAQDSADLTPIGVTLDDGDL